MGDISLGDMIGIIRTANAGDPLARLDLTTLTEINDFCTRCQHDASQSSWGLGRISDTDLRPYAGRALEFIQGV